MIPMLDLENVFTISEAAEKFGISSEMLKNYCRGIHRGKYYYPPRFTNEECRLSGKIWLITYSGLNRVFDLEKNKK